MMAHIELERWADLILFYPASANAISELASGGAKSLPGAIFLAHEFKKPFLIAPAMNQAMWNHPAVRKNLSTLREWGVQELSPGIGMLACGETGPGRLQEPEKALQSIREALNARSEEIPSPKKSILITAGGTTEPIDEVRHLANFSTGKTGHGLALFLKNAGFDVCLMQAETSPAREGIPDLVLYSNTRDFGSKLKRQLEERNFDWVIHAAAVADYRIESASDASGGPIALQGKLQEQRPLYLKLVPNPKIIRELRTWSRNKTIQIISFKLTSDEKTDLKLESYDSEWIIQNHLKDAQGEKHRGRIFKRSRDGQYLECDGFPDKSQLYEQIRGILEGSPGQEKP
jgi:phosphopantothenoylcysteine decarboxylase/phosphopantothenate--cysteine ligase